MNKVKLFEERQVCAVWDEEAEKWWFSIVDIVSVLTDQEDELKSRKYWNKLKQRLKEEGNETVTNCHQLKMLAKDGKMRITDAADTEQVLRLVQIKHLTGESAVSKLNAKKTRQRLLKEGE